MEIDWKTYFHILIFVSGFVVSIAIFSYAMVLWSGDYNFYKDFEALLLTIIWIFFVVSFLYWMFHID